MERKHARIDVVEQGLEVRRPVLVQCNRQNAKSLRLSLPPSAETPL
jgi:hypothetical protein